MAVYLFPGQGSQKIGMGQGLFDKYPAILNLSRDILGYDLKEICTLNPDNKLNQTLYTQPALFTVNAMSYMDKVSSDKIDAGGIMPSYVIGHSLGEYNAFLAAEACDFPTGLKLVKKRAELMSKAIGGGMAAVIGLSAERILEALKNSEITSIDIANYNNLSQLIISGPKQDIDKAKTILELAGARMVVPLNVSGAFHSRYMRDAAEEFAEYIKNFTFSPTRITVISNVEALPAEAKDIPSLTVKQIYSPVKWTDSIVYLLNKGETEFVEIGPGQVLTGLVNAIKRDIKN